MPNPYEVELQTTYYTSAMELLLQQTESKLRAAVTSAMYKGKMASPIQQASSLEFKAPVGRYADKVPQIEQYTRRWVFPTDRELSTMVDQFDELKSIVDPKSILGEAIRAAFNRFVDDTIIGCAFAAASTGVDASSLSTETFDTTNALVADTFGASASTGMTYPKLTEAWRIMEHHQVDLDADRPSVVIGSQQHADLKKQAEVLNRDFNPSGSTERGAVPNIAGFDVIRSERLQTSSSNTLRNCIAFVKSGIHLGVWKDLAVSINRQITKSGEPWEAYAMASVGGTRTQQFKVIQINCADTTGADPQSP